MKLVQLAVVGHTNTGKTSLLRTLTRDASFGQVSNSPATTRHVEASSLLVRGEPAARLFDTPGLEDSTGLLDHLDALRRQQGGDAAGALQSFLQADDHGRFDPGPFDQEAKALRQVVACDGALYVIDARERVLAKYRDELEILGRCARPVLPLLNFVADPEARPDLWREQLARVNMHAVAQFDTVVFDELGELRLFESLRVLLDRFAPTFEALMADARERRALLRRSSAGSIADLLIDVAALRLTVPEGESEATAALASLQETVRQREQRAVDQLLELHRFAPGDYLSESLPIVDGKWGLDLFSPDSLVEFGLTTGGAAASGALAGLAIDLMVGGITLGAAAAAGATVGGLIGAARSRGRELLDGLRGHRELRIEDAILDLLALRQVALVRALLRRGHASQERVRTDPPNGPPIGDKDDADLARALRKELARLRHRPEWSHLLQPESSNGGRATCHARLTEILAEALEGAR